MSLDRVYQVNMGCYTLLYDVTYLWPISIGTPDRHNGTFCVGTDEKKNDKSHFLTAMKTDIISQAKVKVLA